MKSPAAQIAEQIRRNAVALISLVIAITSLGYNTWRNEVSEHNRTQRWGAFETLLMLGELEQLTFDAHYGDGPPQVFTRRGWATVRTIRDIAMVVEHPVPSAADTLHATWSLHSAGLGSDADSVEAIREAIADTREATREALAALQ
ncbi:MAG: hypothetical protein AAF660_13550 [Pseudomonadota bacterium]